MKTQSHWRITYGTKFADQCRTLGKHLLNIENSGKFQYARELGFSTNEECDAQRFIAIALSQRGLQSILKAGITEFEPYLRTFESGVKGIFGDKRFTIEFCYRMIIAVK